MSLACVVYVFGYARGLNEAMALSPPTDYLRPGTRLGLGIPVLFALAFGAICLLVGYIRLAHSLFSGKNRVFAPGHILTFLISLPGTYLTLGMLWQMLK